MNATGHISHELPAKVARRTPARLRRYAWALWLVVVFGLTAAYFALSGVAQDTVYALADLTAGGAVLLGLRLHRPTRQGPWRLIGGALLLSVAGDLTYNLLENAFGFVAPFPSPADIFYLSHYALLIFAMVLLIRSRRPGRDSISLIDALIFSTALGVVSWVYLVSPLISHDFGSIAAAVLSITYPLLDILLAMMLARLATAGWVRLPSFYFLQCALFCYLVSDSLYAYTTLSGTYRTGTMMDLGWMLAFGLFGAAALHPSMRRLHEPAPAAVGNLSIARLTLLGTAALMPAVLLGVEAARGVTLEEYIPAVVVGTIGLTILIGARMTILLRALIASASSYEQASARETVLRETAAALVVAVDVESISRLGVEAALGLLGGSDGAQASLWLGDAGEMKLSARLGRWEASSGDIASISVVTHDQVKGALNVSAWRPLSNEVRDSLATLASEIALALERAELMTDLEERSKRAELRVREAEGEYKELVEHVPAVVYTAGFGGEGDWLYVSPEISNLLGYSPAEWMGDRTLWLRCLHPDDREAQIAREEYCRATGEDLDAEYRMSARDGREVWVRDQAAVVHSADGEPLYLQGFMTDVTPRKSLESQLEHQAFHDPLTNLANRHLFVDRVAHALARRERRLAVLFMDLDDFKLINDSLGHNAGDQLLIEVAERLGKCLREADTAARLGGDEFAVLIEDVSDATDAVRVAERITESLLAPFELLGKEVFVYASIGVALSGESGDTADDLLRNADVAMYRAKGKGKKRHEIFEPSMHSAVVERLELTADMQRALEQDEFVVYYQPIIDLDSERIVGFEALLRWRHPQRGLIQPMSFIPLAEETSLILPMGEWVLEQACLQVRSWQQAWGTRPPLTVSVNISGRQLAQPDTVEQVAEVLQRSSFEPRCLILEITESVLMQDRNATVAKLEALRSLGIRIAIDDFGTGYSSLSYLRQFPVDILKIDRTFVEGIARGQEDSALARAVVKLGDTMNLTVVAEGIETHRQLEELRALGCGLGQGFLFARPLDAVAVNQLLVSAGSEMSLGAPGAVQSA